MNFRKQLLCNILINSIKEITFFFFVFVVKLYGEFLLQNIKSNQVIRLCSHSHTMSKMIKGEASCLLSFLFFFFIFLILNILLLLFLSLFFLFIYSLAQLFLASFVVSSSYFSSLIIFSLFFLIFFLLLLFLLLN